MSVDQQTASQEMSERIAQTLFSTVAKDLGVLPEQVFAEYGPKSVLTSADATRTADGKLQVTSDRARQLFAQTLRGDQQSFSQHGTAKENVHRGLKAIKALLSKKQSVTDAMTYNGSPVDFDYGYEGDVQINAGGRRKGETGSFTCLRPGGVKTACPKKKFEFFSTIWFTPLHMGNQQIDCLQRELPCN